MPAFLLLWLVVVDLVAELDGLVPRVLETHHQLHHLRATMVEVLLRSLLPPVAVVELLQLVPTELFQHRVMEVLEARHLFRARR